MSEGLRKQSSAPLGAEVAFPIGLDPFNQIGRKRHVVECARIVAPALERPLEEVYGDPRFGGVLGLLRHQDERRRCDRIGILARGSLQTVASVENVLNEGIEGYYLYTSSKAGNSETFAPKDQLTQIINDMNLRGERITLIEPKRKNLEAFFLDIVQYKNK